MPRKKKETKKDKNFREKIEALVIASKSSKTVEEEDDTQVMVDSWLSDAATNECEELVVMRRKETTRKIRGKTYKWGKGVILGTWELTEAPYINSELFEKFGGGEYLIKGFSVKTGEPLKPIVLRLPGPPRLNQKEQPELFDPDGFDVPDELREEEDTEPEGNPGMLTKDDLFHVMTMFNQQNNKGSQTNWAALGGALGASLGPVLDFLSSREERRAEEARQRAKEEREERQREHDQRMKEWEHRIQKQREEAQRRHDMELETIKERNKMDFQRLQWDREQKGEDTRRQMEWIQNMQSAQTNLHTEMAKEMVKSVRDGIKFQQEEMRHDLKIREKLTDFEIEQKLKKIEAEGESEMAGVLKEGLVALGHAIASRSGVVPGQLPPHVVQAIQQQRGQLAAPGTTPGEDNGTESKTVQLVAPEFIRGINVAMENNIPPQDFLEEALEVGAIQEVMLEKVYDGVVAVGGEPAASIQSVIEIFRPYAPPREGAKFMSLLGHPKNQKWIVEMCTFIAQTIEADKEEPAGVES